MVTFIKKIKTKEGINSFDLDKIKKSIPASYKVIENTPTISYTANHVLVIYKCQLQKQEKAQPKSSANPKAKAK
jgi:hypothetical protein